MSHTSSSLTKFERIQVIGMRAEQIARGAQPFVDLPPPNTPFSAYDIAEREMAARRLPFVVVRHLPDGKTERIRLTTPAAEQ